MRPYVAELSKICDTYICVYPNAGLPNPMADTGFDETPEDTSSLLEEFAKAGLVNMAGGCRSEEHTSELQSLMRLSYAVFCLKKIKYYNKHLIVYSHHTYLNNNI